MQSEILRTWWKLARENPAVPDVYAAHLWRKMSRGDEQARDEFIRAHIWLVVFQAQRMTHRVPSRHRDDMVAAACFAGVVGLYHSLLRFDQTRGLKFSTYARDWIRQRIQRELKIESELIRIPAWRGKEKLRFVSTTAPMGAHDADDADRSAFMQLESPTPEPHAIAQARETRDRIECALTRLTPRERQVVRLRYGLDAPAQSIAEIGATLGISRQRADQLERKALAKMAVMLSERPR
jgi:RNA polymerase sigma factor (sigma-70 family)